MMRKILARLGGLLLAAIAVHANAETLAQYVSACRTQLNIPASKVISDMDCYDGDLFRDGGDVHDRMGYVQVTDQVDIAFACRWVFGDKTARQEAVSVELLMHNRQNGNTCFFSALGSMDDASHARPLSQIVSPTSSNAANYWAQPQDVNDKIRCIGCHVSGAYISTPHIVPYLAKYGLLNNGHDTLSNVTSADLNSNPGAHVKYHAVVTPAPAVSAFASWNSLKQSYAVGGCSQGCHLLGIGSPQGAIMVDRKGPETVLEGAQDIYDETAPVMAPTAYDSHYRWINLDNPVADGVETENFANAMNATSLLVPYVALPTPPDGSDCPAGSVPTDMEVHAVGVNVENSFSFGSVTWFTEKLRAFNLKDGLVCLNADQDPGVTCRDFDMSYLCPDNVTWTGYYNHTVNSGNGDDHEERSFSNNAIVAACGGQQPIAIRARIFTAARGGPVPQVVVGPNDRLARFSQYGLTCGTSDQPDGKCSNYVVRFQGCGPKPTNLLKHLTNVFTGKQLTASGAGQNALVKDQPFNSGWNTQQWQIEPVANTEYVRLKNTGTLTYLNLTSNAEQATVVSSTSSTSTSQLWVVESVTFSPNDFRLRNVSSGKYLTAQDPKLASDPNYLAVYSQGKNPGWTSQRWVIN